MYESPFAQIRRRVGMGMFGLGTFGVLWMLTPGLPVLRGPQASAEVRAAGLELFEHEWQPHDPLAGGDGLGPVFNARSCVECHFQGGAGGGGDNKHNVLAFEAFPTQDRPEVKGGLIHRFAVANHFLEGRSELNKFFPIVPGGTRVEGGCQVFTQDFDPVHTETVNSTALFGAGWIDRISGKTIRYQSMSDRDRRGRQRDHRQFRRGGAGAARACCPTAAWASSAGRPSSPPWRSSSPPRAPTRSAWATPAWSRPGRWSAWTTRRSIAT